MNAPGSVMVLGGTGMLGHVLCEELARSRTVVATHRRTSGLPDIEPFRSVAGERLEAGDVETLRVLLDKHRPDTVVNCIGIVKQVERANEPTAAIGVNSLWPHQVSEACDRTGSRMIHISTDCVFSGSVGSYTEQDRPDPVDLYGRCKLLGEVSKSPHLTMRTSMVGRELQGEAGLLEWLLSCNGGTVRGFTNAFFSGPTTHEVARVIDGVLDRPDLTGVYHVAAEAISKYDLLALVRTIFGLHIEITVDDELRLDRTLDNNKLRSAMAVSTPTWPELIHEIYDKGKRYDHWRK